MQGGALASVTAGSLIGQLRQRTSSASPSSLIEAELVHNVTSDAHDAERRPPSIAHELERAGLAALADWLTEEIPAAILAGAEEMPARPAASLRPRGSRRRSWWRRGPLRRAS